MILWTLAETAAQTPPGWGATLLGILGALLAGSGGVVGAQKVAKRRRERSGDTPDPDAADVGACMVRVSRLLALVEAAIATTARQREEARRERSEIMSTLEAELRAERSARLAAVEGARDQAEAQRDELRDLLPRLQRAIEKIAARETR